MIVGIDILILLDHMWLDSKNL